MNAPNATRIWHDLHYRHTEPATHPKMWRRFVEVDPFNPGNKLTGHVQFIGGDEYGALAISHVNDRPASQFIRVTPKAAYPFYKDGSWVLYDAHEVSAFEKIDGTNICQYGYRDADGRSFTSFKLRTRPFMSPHFLNLLERALERYPGVRNHRLQPGEAVAYELFGYENRMLIKYGEDIDLALIFGRNSEGDIVAPHEGHAIFDGVDCLAAGRRPIDLAGEFAETYRRRQQEISSRLVKLEDEYFEGEEGEMLYVRFADGSRDQPGSFTRLIKLKPPEIEEIHWALDHVPKEEAAAVARNVFEVSDSPTVTDMVQLLAEEWSDEQITRSLDTIAQALQEATDRRDFQERGISSLCWTARPQRFPGRSLSGNALHEPAIPQVHDVQGLLGSRGTWVRVKRIFSCQRRI